MLSGSASLPARFSAADDAWIDVRRHTSYRQVGLRELFLSAHTLDDLALALAPAASSLLRICAVITARITGLDDSDLTASQWNDRRRQAFARGHFAPTAVNTYFDDPAHCFEVFDPQRPFLQEPLLAQQCPAPSGINKLVWGRPAGNNLAWMSPHHDLAPVTIRTGQALLHLLIHHYYGAAGTYTPRTVGTRAAYHKATSGPLRSTVSFHPLGRTLFETLLAQVPKSGQAVTEWDTEEDLGGSADADRCPWESAQHPGPYDPPPPVTWPGRLLTGRSRHAILLVPAAGGTEVKDVYLTWGVRTAPLPVTDPYLIMHTAGDRHPQRRRSPRRADADRAWWRELDALLLAPDEHHAFRRPEIFDTLNDLPAPVRAALRVRVHGFDQDGKTNNRRWYTAITPPLLAWAQENDPQSADRIARCVQAAEIIGLRLATVTARAWKDTIDGPAADGTGSPAPAGGHGKKDTRARSPWTQEASALYWQLAEAAFWRLLESPDDPVRAAFANAAAHALRQVTSADRVRHRHAARAIATAVTELQRPPRVPATKDSR